MRFGIVILIFVITGCEWQSRNIKALPDDLEPIVEYMYIHYDSSDYYLNELAKEFPKLISNLQREHNLCSVIYSYRTGIVFVFSCTRPKDFDTFFDIHYKYNLFKIFDESQKQDLLTRVQYADFGLPYESLDNGWYYIQQNIGYN